MIDIFGGNSKEFHLLSATVIFQQTYSTNQGIYCSLSLIKRNYPAAHHVTVM